MKVTYIPSLDLWCVFIPSVHTLYTYCKGEHLEFSTLSQIKGNMAAKRNYRNFLDRYSYKKYSLREKDVHTSLH